MVGLPAAPFINVLLPLLMEPKTDYRRLPNTRATTLFSYCDIRVGHAACLTTKPARRESESTEPRRSFVVLREKAFSLNDRGKIGPKAQILGQFTGVRLSGKIEHREHPA